MDQTQTTNPADSTTASVDNDLQKAIDDIANTTSVDPVFSDPVAAPSSVPEGDTGELGEPVGPFPEPKIETPAPQNTGEIKKAALRDLAPLLDKVNMDAPERFNIYRDIFEELKDYTVLQPAYEAAREIPDETARANALLYLVQSIDKM